MKYINSFKSNYLAAVLVVGTVFGAAGALPATAKHAAKADTKVSSLEHEKLAILQSGAVETSVDTDSLAGKVDKGHKLPTYAEIEHFSYSSMSDFPGAGI